MFTSTPRSVKKKKSSSSFQLPPVPPLKPQIFVRRHCPVVTSATLIEPPSFLKTLYPSLSQDDKGNAREERSKPGRDEMDVEPPALTNRNPNLLLKNEKHAVTFLGPLPSQVAQLFAESSLCKLYFWLGRIARDVANRKNDADFYQNTFMAYIFPQTGHAMVLSRTSCFVWSYKTVNTLPLNLFLYRLSLTGLAISNNNQLATCHGPANMLRIPFPVFKARTGSVKYSHAHAPRGYCSSAIWHLRRCGSACLFARRRVLVLGEPLVVDGRRPD